MTVKIVIPKGKHSKIADRRPHYVSSATTQLVIDVQTGCPSSCSSISGFPETVPLTPTSTGCSSTLASTECQLTLQLSPGSYTGTLTTEDAQNRALSTAQNVALDVVAGTSNSLSATLSGIPLSIVASVLSATANTILVQALDADNNSITGPGSPTFSVTRANGIAVVYRGPGSDRQRDARRYGKLSVGHDERVHVGGRRLQLDALAFLEQPRERPVRRQ